MYRQTSVITYFQILYICDFRGESTRRNCEKVDMSAKINKKNLPVLNVINTANTISLEIATRR